VRSEINVQLTGPNRQTYLVIKQVITITCALLRLK